MTGIYGGRCFFLGFRLGILGIWFYGDLGLGFWEYGFTGIWAWDFSAGFWAKDFGNMVSGFFGLIFGLRISGIWFRDFLA